MTIEIMSEPQINQIALMTLIKKMSESQITMMAQMTLIYKKSAKSFNQRNLRF